MDFDSYRIQATARRSDPADQQEVSALSIVARKTVRSAELDVPHEVLSKQPKERIKPTE